MVPPNNKLCWHYLLLEISLSKVQYIIIIFDFFSILKLEELQLVSRNSAGILLFEKYNVHAALRKVLSFESNTQDIVCIVIKSFTMYVH